VIKSELVARLTARHGLPSKRIAEQAVSIVFDAVVKALARGARVELRGFGAFSVKVRPPRTGRNPRNGMMVALGERKLAYFRCGKELREQLNKQPVQGEDRKVAGAVVEGI
jgi:integration host factor subunit beta